MTKCLPVLDELSAAVRVTPHATESYHILCDALSIKTYIITAVIPHLGLILTAVTVEQGYPTAARECAHAKREQRTGGTDRTSTGTSWLEWLARHMGTSCMLFQPQA